MCFFVKAFPSNIEVAVEYLVVRHTFEEMPRKKNKRTQATTTKQLEDRVAAMTLSSSSSSVKSSSPTSTPPPPFKPPSEDLTWLRNVIRGRDSVDALVTKHIFDKLKRSRISRDQIVDILLETGCPLDFALLMDNAEVIRAMLERKKEIPKKESIITMELAMRMPYLDNIKVLVQCGPGAKARRDLFTSHMFEMLNSPSADLVSARKYVEQLVNAGVIDEYTIQFLEKTFEAGTPEAIRMLLDMRIDDYVRRKTGDDLLVHIFGNVKVDAVEVLRGRRFNVNAKCGEMAALHFATLCRSERNVRILLNSGADPNVRDCHGMSPLFAFGDDKCIKLLLQNGADVQSVADNGYTILHMFFHPSLLAIMLAHTALIEARGVKIKKELRDKIVENAGFIECYDKACEQIEDMKKCRIHDGFTLWTALVRRPETIARFVGSQKDVEELICECRVMPVHPYYRATLEMNFERAYKVWELRAKAMEKIVGIFEVLGLDELIVERIVEFLGLEDLMVFA